MYPIGPASYTTNFLDTSGPGGLPASLQVQNPSDWGIVSNAITARNPLTSSHGCLKTSGTITGTDYVTTLDVDGNRGLSKKVGAFYLDSTGTDVNARFSLEFTFDQGYNSASDSMVHGITFTLQEFGRQALLDNFTPMSRLAENDIYLPALYPYGSYTRPVGVFLDRWYDIYVLHWANCFRIGIYDAEIINPGTGLKGGFVCLQGETPTGSNIFQSGGGVWTGTAWDTTGGDLWHYSGGTYTYPYSTTFHTAQEFQTDQCNAAWRMGIKASTLSTRGDGTNCNVYLSGFDWEDYEELWWPKNVFGIQPSMIAGGIAVPTPVGTADWQGLEGPIITLTAVTTTTMDLNIKSPVGGTGVTYSLNYCNTVDGSSADTPLTTGSIGAGVGSTNIHVTGLTQNTLNYFQFVVTGTDQMGVVRVVSYPLCAFRTLNATRAAQIIYFDSAGTVAGNGTISTPFRTFKEFNASAFFDTLVPGDTLQLQSGAGQPVYAGTLSLLNASGVAGTPITVVSSDATHPAVLNNPGYQYDSGDNIQLINVRWVSILPVNITGPGQQQVGIVGNVEQAGMTAIGAGNDATRTCTANHGIYCVSTELTVLPSMQNPQTGHRALTNFNTPAWNGTDFGDATNPGYSGEDELAHRCGQGILIDNVNIDGCFFGISVFCIGTHENVVTTTVTGSGTAVPFYEVNLRAAQEFVVIQNTIILNTISMAFTMLADPFHRRPGVNGMGQPYNDTGVVTAVNPVNDPWVFDNNALGTDPFVQALFGFPGTIIRADLFNAGPTVNWNTNGHLALLNLIDFNPLMPHEKILCMNMQCQNVPGDCFVGAGGSLYNGTGLIGTGAGYAANPDGDTGYGFNIASVREMLCDFITVSNTGRCQSGTGGPVGFLTTNCHGVWLQHFFGFEAHTRNSDGAIMDIDARSRNVTISHWIAVNNPGGVCESSQNGNVNHNHVTLWNCGVGVDHQGGGNFYQLLGTGGAAVMWNRIIKYDDQAKSSLLGNQFAVIANAVNLGTNVAQWDALPFANAGKLHRMWNSWLFNLGAGGTVSTSAYLDFNNITLSDPALSDLFDAGLFSYPLVVPATSPNIDPTIIKYNWAWALGNSTNFVTHTNLGPGVTPQSVGIDMWPELNTNLAGQPLIGNAVGPMQLGGAMPTPVDVQNFDTTTPGTTPTGWVLGASHAVANVGVLASSSPNVLRQATATNTDLSYETTQDTNNGKTSWAFAIQPVGTQLGGAAQYFICMFRIVSGTTYATATCYNVQIVFAGGTSAGNVALFSRTANVDTAIGSTVTVANNIAQGLQWNGYYQVLITADDPDSSGSLITIQIQRVSDSFYLNSSGVFQSGQAYVIAPAQSATNISALKHNSNVGIVLYKDTGATSLMFDSSDYESLAASTATSYTQSLSASSGFVGSPVTITYTANGTTTAVVTPNPTPGVAGTYSPTTIALNNTTPVTQTFTPSATGVATLVPTNSGSLTNPGSNTYTVSAAPAYSVTSTLNAVKWNLVGTGTSWAGTPFTLISGGGSITQQAVTDTTHATLTITGGTSPWVVSDGVGTFTLRATTSGGGGTGLGQTFVITGVLNI